MSYKLTPLNGVIRLLDGAYLPCTYDAGIVTALDEFSSSVLEFKAWVALGNVPAAADPVPPAWFRPQWLGVNGGLIFQGSVLLGSLPGASFQTLADQPIPISSADYALTNILVSKPTGNPLALAVGGFYTGANKTGTTLVVATQSYVLLTTANHVLDLAFNTLALRRTEQTLFLSLSVINVLSAFADIHVFGVPFDA